MSLTTCPDCGYGHICHNPPENQPEVLGERKRIGQHLRDEAHRFYVGESRLSLGPPPQVTVGNLLVRLAGEIERGLHQWTPVTNRELWR